MLGRKKGHQIKRKWFSWDFSTKNLLDQLNGCMDKNTEVETQSRDLWSRAGESGLPTMRLPGPKSQPDGLRAVWPCVYVLFISVAYVYDPSTREVKADGAT